MRVPFTTATAAAAIAAAALSWQSPLPAQDPEPQEPITTTPATGEEDKPGAEEKAEASAAATAAPVPATQTDLLKSKEGEVMTVAGHVEEVGASRSGHITFINFKGGDFTAIVVGEDLETLEKDLGGNVRDSLRGKDITVHGKISTFKDTPQIKITSIAQIGLDGAMPPAAGGGAATIKPTVPDRVMRARDEREIEDAYRLGSEVGVTGKIKECSQNSSKSILFIHIQSADIKGVIFSAELPAIRKAIGHEDDEAFMKALKGEQVMLIGQIEKYNDNSQIVIRAASQIYLNPPPQAD